MNGFATATLNRVRFAALVTAALGIVACIVGAALNRKQFFISYLFGYLFWLGLALGCLGVAMLHHLTGGRWGFVTRRFFESGFRTLPLMALLFIPLLFGLRDLYPWAQAHLVTTDPVLQHKHAYMNFPGFIVRGVFFFAVWIVFASLLGRWSSEQDATADPSPTRKLRSLSGPGIVIYPLTATFAYVDWLMSLEPDWYSTIFMVIILIGQILSALAFAVVMLALFRTTDPISQVISTEHFHHLGNLLFTFVMFWTYVAFSQFLIIWSGNLPHEISWYLHRSRGSWLWLVMALALFHFFVPFYLLLFRVAKRSVRVLAAIAVLVFVMHLLNVFWLVVPSFYPGRIHLSWLDFITPLTVGGLWLALFVSRLRESPLLPLNDVRFDYAYLNESC